MATVTGIPKTPRRHAAPDRGARLALSPMAAALAALFAGAPAWAQLPTVPTVVNGSASVLTSGNQMTVFNSPNAIINWQTFSIGAAQQVRFQQETAASQVLNRVLGNDPSQILGSLTSNGRVWLINPNGVLFGQNARIDVAGLVASTVNIADADFLAGRYKFVAPGDGPEGTVLNQGEIRTVFGGRVFLIGDSVRNDGLIESPGGAIVLAAGKSVELLDSGLPNIVVRVTAPANETVNLGQLVAKGGAIDLYGGVVNQSGIIQADGEGMDAGGRVVLSASHGVSVGDGSRTTADGAAGGRVTIDGGAGDTLVTGQVSARGHDGIGGEVRLLGEQVGIYGQAVADVSGSRGGGQILVGGGYQGRDPEVANARATYVGAEASLLANALDSGDGGRIIVWADEATRVYGSIEARGGPQGGDGGFVETSGGWLDAQPAWLDLGAAKGRPGTWLLDPNDIRIDYVGASGASIFTTGDATGPVFTSPGDSSVASAPAIAELLSSGTNVTVQTGTAGTNSQAGNITVAVNIGASGAAPGSLTLAAHNNIIMDPGVEIRSYSGPMGVTFIADSDGNGSGAISLANGAHIITLGGNISLGGPSHAAGSNGGVVLDGSLVDAGSGNVSIRGRGTGSSAAGVTVQSGATVRGGSVAIDGVADGTGPGVWVRDGASVGATAGSLSIRGDSAGQDILLEGPTTTIGSVTSSGNIDLVAATGDGFGRIGLRNGVRVQTQGAVNISAAAAQAPLAAAPGMVSSSGLAGSSALAPAVLELDFAGGSPDFAASIRRINISGPDVLLRDSLVTASPLLISAAGATTLAPGATIASGASGDAIVLATGRFDNQSGGDALAAPSGRWLIYSTEPRADRVNGLPADFVQFGITYPQTPTAAGNGLLYESAGSDVPPVVEPVYTSTTNTTVESLNNGLQTANDPAQGVAVRPSAYASYVGVSRSVSVADLTAASLRSLFGIWNLIDYSRGDLERLLESRKEFKKKLFADAIYKLEQDPSLADVPVCATAAEVNTGNCRISDAQRDALIAGTHVAGQRVRVAKLPKIERKIAVLFGINDYADRKIPALESAIPDARAVGKTFADKLGYEVRVVNNPTRADIVRTMNGLSLETRPTDSVVVYYAGHGYLNEKTGTGYWIPADGRVTDPGNWLTNTDVSKFLASINARQIALVSDSCYSGAFTREQKVSPFAGTPVADQILARRSVVVMSSGGDEPVSDEGKDGHSIFAWNLMRSVGGVDNWQPGSSIFETVRREVLKDFPQTPQYGAAASAGHESGGDYLFEFRQLEDSGK